MRGFRPASLPVCGDVAGVPDRDAERVESAGELLEDLERSGLLSLDPEVVDGVDERHRVPVRELADELQRLVEVAPQRHHPRPVHQRLRELAGGDLALGNDHRAS